MDPERTKLTAPERIYLGYTSFWYETSEEGLHDIEYVRADLVTTSDAEQPGELRLIATGAFRFLDAINQSVQEWPRPKDEDLSICEIANDGSSWNHASLNVAQLAAITDDLRAVLNPSHSQEDGYDPLAHT